MIHMYQSNALEALGQILSQVMKTTPLSDAFEQEIIVAQSLGMNRWLASAIVNEINIYANVRFKLPAAIAWQLVQNQYPGIPRKSPFDPSVMRWKILDDLKHMDEMVALYPELAALQHHDQPFDLACTIADVFDQYLVYRPDWIERWEHEQAPLLGFGQDEVWQRILWRRLRVSFKQFHRVQWLKSLHDIKAEHCPSRIHFFGIAHLPPLYLELLQYLARSTEIHLYLLNPCAEYWEDSGQYATIIPGQDAQADHPLLASCGHQGRCFFGTIESSFHGQLDDTRIFVKPQASTLLHQLQRDILSRNMPQQGVFPSDVSIRVMSCYSPVRELEVLRDQLLHSLETCPDLYPDDMVVMTPNIAQYAPYINQVFQKQEFIPFIPYAIADYAEEKNHSIGILITRLFDLVQSRLYREDVFALLYSQHFDFSLGEIEQLERWAEDAGIFWGINDEHVASCGVPTPASHSWQAGLQRIFLGQWSIPLSSTHVYPNPCVGSLSSDAHKLLHRWLVWLEQLWTLLDVWGKPAPMLEWQKRIQWVLKDWLVSKKNVQEDARLINSLLKQIDDWVDEVKLAGVPELEVQSRDVAILWSNVGGVVDQHRFLAGGLNFCGMVPMRSIPFRQVYLIGLHHDAYPREEKTIAFDLIAQHPKPWDRSRQRDDRYLFLEAIMSARERLYCSYVAYPNMGTERVPPSLLIQELLEVLQVMHPEFDVEETARHLFSVSSSQNNYYTGLDASVLLDYQCNKTRERYEIRHAPATDFSFWESFWRHPLRFFFRYRQGLEWPASFVCKTKEPLSFHRMYTVQDLSHIDQRIDDLKSAGFFPDHRLGDVYKQQEIERQQTLDHIDWGDIRESYCVAQSVEERVFIHPVYGQMVLLPQRGKIVAQWAAWRRHLMLQHQQPTPTRVIDFEKPSVKDWPPISTQEAKEAFGFWIEAYQWGQSNPLPWVPACWDAYMKLYSDAPYQASLAIKKVWDGRSSDFLNRLFWSELPSDMELWAIRLVHSLYEYNS